MTRFRREEYSSTLSRRLDMALEAIVYMKTLRLIKKDQGKGYLIYCETENVDDDY